ncbi:hypothetical protein V493_01556 [Pseudogymnoascus sp. VKM F-4281 (FW-2241)]|nr:hypothetical protein V493_01556 [Pseudogymnoascus sp. VKM F-4281 (FW-2241)]
MVAVNFLRLAAMSQAASAATVYLAGDSTMAKGGGGGGGTATDGLGWGQYLADSLSIPVVNNAIGGRSARSFTREGRFDTIIEAVVSGDIVVIEFGHNDGGSLTPTDNGRTDCGGTGDETCETVYDGVAETVLTFPRYLENAANAITAKGAFVVISSQTPNNPFESGEFIYSGSRFVDMAALAASNAGVDYVDHGQYTANAFEASGAETVNAYFPNDHTHTSPAGALAVGDAFLIAWHTSKMKFAKELEQDLVPEWRVKYLDYKAGKKRVKAVGRAVARANANATPRSGRLNPRDHYRSNGSPTLTRKVAAPAAHRQPTAHGFNSLPERHGTASRPTSDESDQLTKPILINRRNGKETESTESTELQYGSFVPTPPTDYGPVHLELPDPALGTGLVNSPPGKTADKTSRPQPGRSATDKTVPASYHAYTAAERGTTPKRPAIADMFNRGSSMTVTGSTANNPSHGDPKPLLKRIWSRSGVGRDEVALDVNMIPLDYVKAKEKEFFDWMDGQLDKVETFYKEKEDEAGERLIVLRGQLHEMRNRRIEEISNFRKVKRASKREAAKSIDDMSGNPSPSSGSGTPVPNQNILKRPVTKALDGLKFGQRLGVNSKALRDMHLTPNLQPSEGPQDVSRRMDPSRDYVRRAHENDVPYRSAKRKLKLALKEYYRGLELLKSYALLNRTAFRKINKKYDKAANAHPPLRYMSDKVNKAWFVQSRVLDSHLHAVEDLYARYFERGNHKVATGKLRSSNGKLGQYTASAFRSGLLIGTGAVFGIQGLINAATILRNQSDPVIHIRTGYLLQIYGGYFLALYLFSFFCIDCSVWAANKINYVFIFEFDPRNNLDWRQLAEFPSFLTLLLGLFLWLNFSGLGTPDMYLYYPVILLFVTLVLIFLPAPILFNQSRRWFAYAHWRLLLAGLYPVEFRDFFLGDMYCSLTYVTANIELFFCLYASHWSDPPQCNSGHSRLLGFFTALPGIWRALQCLRRYYDTRSAFPHLANFGKYSTTILYYITLSLYRIKESHTRLAIFITVAVVNSIYSTLWDLFMDWSLLQPTAKHKFLRPVLGYKSPWYYYSAIVFDVLLRFNWIFYAFFTHNTQHSTIASFFISFSEANRRGVWTLFRVENEHAANVMRFKASRDVPLPYKLHDTDETSTSESIVQPVVEDGEVAKVHSGSLRPTPGPGQSRFRARTSSAARAEEQGPGSLRRRMTITKIMAEAHTQDFVKKKGKDEVAGEAATREESSWERGSSDDDDEDDGSPSDGREEEELTRRETEEVRQAQRNAGREGLKEIL